MHQKLHILLIKIKERRLLQHLFYYLIGVIGFFEAIIGILQFSDIRDFWSFKIIMFALVLCSTGTLIVLITSWFHGEKGKDPITKMEVLLIAICITAGGCFTIKILLEPTPITILIRMMEPQDNWFKENIIKEFEEEFCCKVNIKRFNQETEVVKILKSEKATKKSSNISLVKTPLPLTYVLSEEELARPIEDIIGLNEVSKAEGTSGLCKIEDEYNPESETS